MNLPTESIVKVGSRIEISKIASIVSPIAAIVISLLVIGLVVWPKFSQVLRLRSANEQLAVRAKALEEKALRLQDLNADQLAEQLASGEQLLPSEKAVFTLVAQIEKSALTSGVILSRVEVAPGAIGPAGSDKSEVVPVQPPATPKDEGIDASKVQVKVSIGSDYKSLLQFITNLLLVPRVVSIEDMSIASSGDSNQLKANLAIHAYWQVLPTELPSIESPLPDLTDEEQKTLAAARSGAFVSTSPTVPSVPLGRSDLFAPF